MRVHPLVASWTLAELGRVALLLTAHSRMSVDAAKALVLDLYYRGDGQEKIAVLRALPLLGEHPAYVELAVEACRTNMTSVFQAIACDNSFPHDNFSALHFNQMVMKALFLGVSVGRILGVRERSSQELARMLEDYKREREAAHRSVPGDLDWLLSQVGTS